MAGYGYNTGLDGHRVTPLTEKDAHEIAEGLAFIYEQANNRMLKNVADRLARGVTRPGWAERKASEVRAAHRQLERDLAQASSQRQDILSGLAERCAATGSQKFYQDMRDMLGDTARLSPNSQKAAYILTDMNNTLDAAERRILRQFDDRYADVIGRVSSEMATGVMNTRQAVGDALQAFADQGISGFVDRGGHHWTLENYSEMAVLTAIERATLSSYVDTMQSYGFDLAIIDGHAGACPVCTAWEGVIVSVSGEDHRYPSLGEAENEGVFHPRCAHGITTYYEGISHAPKGGFRNEPRAIKEPSRAYTARSQQRYMERQIRKYKDRLLVAQTNQQKQMARNKIREWRSALNELIDKQPSSNYMYRHGYRETANNRLTGTGKSATLHTKLDANGHIVNPMNQALFDKMRKALERQGITVMQAKDDDLSYLKSLSAEATYGNGYIMHQDAIPSASGFFEEIIHMHQSRLYGELNSSDQVELAAREIDTQYRLLRNGKAYGFTEEDYADIRQNRDRWAEKFKTLTGEEYDPNDRSSQYYRGF